MKNLWQVNHLKKLKAIDDEILKLVNRYFKNGIPAFLRDMSNGVALK